MRVLKMIAPAVDGVWEKTGYLMENGIFIMIWTMNNQEMYTSKLFPLDSFKSALNGFPIGWGAGVKDYTEDFQWFVFKGTKKNIVNPGNFLQNIIQDRTFSDYGCKGNMDSEDVLAILI